MLQIVTSWDRLRQGLLKAIDRQRYYFGHVFKRVEQDDSGVRVHFANGGSARADLLVACDGSRSTVRAQLAPEVQPMYSGYLIGAERRTNPISRRKPVEPCSRTFPSFSPIGSRPWGIRSPAQMMNCGPATGVTISAGTAWQLPRN
jgi:2-polyprenyl-6-methoxyphenol hydroxylase-like FAD-dependent oxidoreductase